MLLSMTGFGRSTGQYQDKLITVDLKSLNSKFMDLRIRVPQNYRSKEVQIRQIINNVLTRGKVELNIDVKSEDGAEAQTINHRLFKSYYNDIQALNKTIGFDTGDILQTILRIPNVISQEESEIAEGEWKVITDTLANAIVEFNKFRAQEGDAMEKDLIAQVNEIESFLAEVDPHEKERVEKIKERLDKQLEEQFSKDKVDRNRFEQEIIYYLEKIDITEEKVRLSQHCTYFLEVLGNTKEDKGKKLAFIGQEMGREINTLGAKAYSSELQKLVVGMKDNLEKIKEQLANAC